MDQSDHRLLPRSGPGYGAGGAGHHAPEAPGRQGGDFAGGLGLDVAYQGLAVSVLTLISYFVGHFMESGVWEIANSPDGMTMAFLTLSMAEIVHSLNMRSQRNSIFTLKGQNKALNLAALASLALTTLVIEGPRPGQCLRIYPHPPGRVRRGPGLGSDHAAPGGAGEVLPAPEEIRKLQVGGSGPTLWDGA